MISFERNVTLTGGLHLSAQTGAREHLSLDRDAEANAKKITAEIKFCANRIALASGTTAATEGGKPIVEIETGVVINELELAENWTKIIESTYEPSIWKLTSVDISDSEIIFGIVHKIAHEVDVCNSNRDTSLSMPPYYSRVHLKIRKGETPKTRIGLEDGVNHFILEIGMKDYSSLIIADKNKAVLKVIKLYSHDKAGNISARITEFI